MAGKAFSRFLFRGFFSRFSVPRLFLAFCFRDLCSRFCSAGFFVRGGLGEGRRSKKKRGNLESKFDSKFPAPRT